MPISETGISNRRPVAPAAIRARGFSLLELLVVVAIIGIFTGIAVLSIGVVGRDREIEQEAFRLKSLLDLVREEALMQNRDFGVEFTESGYRFYTYDYEHAAWLESGGDNLLKARELPEPLSLSLLVEDRELVLETAEQEDAPESPKPQVLILADGQITPFRATLSRDVDGPTFTLSAELDGTLEILDEDDDDPSG